jgi:monoamine oxidase
VLGSRWTEAEVLAEAAGFLAGVQADLAGLSQGPNAFAFNETDRRIDRMSISDYLSRQGAGPLLRAVLAPAFAAEYGRDIDQLSALVLLFALVGREPQDVFGPVQLHLVGGNDALPRSMAADLPTPPRLGHRLLQVARIASGRVRLSFATAGGTVQTVHDAVVLALPAALMRDVEFNASAGLTASHRFAIEHFQVGSNSKQMVGFRGRPWRERHASNGTAYADLDGLQANWETNPSEAAFYRRGVLTDFAGGRRAAQLDPARPQATAEAFLQSLETVYPGSAALARRDNRGRVVSHIENWSKLPLFKGAYSCNAPGYFTTLEGRYGLPAGNIVFAGEHTDSFYRFQGYMEGALRSGARAARQLLGG